MSIKLMVGMGDGEILTLDISEGLWVENNMEAHWQIDCLINEAMELKRQEIDYERWLAGPWMEDEWRQSA